jgi:GT2 family glycosyltransferase
MQVARGEVLALVNPDTELPSDALATAAGLLDRYPKAGITGLALRNPDGSVQPSCFAFPDPLNLLVESLGLHRLLVHAGFGVPSLAPEPAGGEGAVGWVSGAFLVIRRDVVERVGGLDERFFMYGEEMDLCWRVRAAGFPVVWSSRCRVLHHGGASGGDARGALFVKNLEGRLAFLRRHRGALAAALGREFMGWGAVLRLAYWRARARRAGNNAPSHVREQLERFEAAAAWHHKAPR